MGRNQSAFRLSASQLLGLAGSVASRLLTVVGVAAAATAVLTPTVAMAQPGGWGGGGGGGGFGRDAFGPSMSEQQLARVAKMLELTDDQKLAAEALLEGYQQQVRDAGEKMREKAEAARAEFRESRDPAVFEGLATAGEELQATRKKLDASLMDDLKAVLTTQQAEKWPAAERTIKREQSLRRGFVSGERVDIVRLVEDGKLPAETVTTLQPTLEQYAEEMARELTKRDELYEASMSKMMQMRQSGDMESMQETIEKGRDAAIKIRDLNRKYARQIIDQLPDDAKTGFETQFREASFPDVYRRGFAGRSIDAAAEFADLDQTQKDGIAALKESYERQVSSINEKLTKAVEENEQAFDVSQMFGRGGDRDDPASDLRREKRELDQSTTESLQKLLKEDQIEKLPKREERGGGGGGRQRRDRAEDDQQT